MGDRGNVVVRQDSKTHSDDVWFYSHWGGCELLENVQSALKRRVRWGDASYLARIIFCQIIGEHTGETDGFGISCAIGDNEHDIIVVDVESESVFVVPKSGLEDGRLPNAALTVHDATHAWAFEKFVALDSLPEM